MKPFLAIQCLMVVYYLILYLLKDEDFTESMLLLVKNGVRDLDPITFGFICNLQFYYRCFLSWLEIVMLQLIL